METINHQDNARKLFVNILNRRGEKVLGVYDKKGGLHRVYKTDKDLYWVIYKSEPFHSFGKFFPHIDNGWGESIDKEMCIQASLIGAKIVWIHDSGHCYWMYASAMKKFAEKYSTIRKVNQKLKRKYLGRYVEIEEYTYSVPFRMIKRFDKE